MVTSTRPPANAFVAAARKIYNPVGFSRGYNFILWFIFAGAFLGFILARLQYLNFTGIYCNPSSAAGQGALPGECWYYLRVPRYKVGIILHLATILPAGLLACVQFTPFIRHRAMLLHRINGWVVVLLSFVGTVAAMMIVRISFGGGIESQTVSGVLAIMFLGSLVLAVVNIKLLQIDQHRAWMLRAWFYAGVIITMRLIMILAAKIISNPGGYHAAMPCGKVDFILKDRSTMEQRYPECTAYFDGSNPEQYAIVPANMSGLDAAQVAAAMNLCAGGAFWLALVLHAIGIEIYLNLTPAEHERLRNVSYQRQLAAGFRRPGYAGLTADRLGDSEGWKPREGIPEEVAVATSSRSNSNLVASP